MIMELAVIDSIDTIIITTLLYFLEMVLIFLYSSSAFIT
jgi:hypothetical protein